jgi:hypothetical protein
MEPPPKRKVLGRVKRYVRRPSTLLHHHHHHHHGPAEAAGESPGDASGQVLHPGPDAQAAAAAPGFDALPAEVPPFTPSPTHPPPIALTPWGGGLGWQLVVGILGWVAGPRELAAAGGTCRAWYAASLEQALWRRLFFVRDHALLCSARPGRAFGGDSARRC